MRRIFFVLASLALTSLAMPLLAPARAAEPTSPASTPARSGGTFDRLGQLFPTAVQQTIGACWDQGKVDLAAGADPDGSVICGDRTAESDVPYADYLTTVSDILVASSLVGFRTVMQTDVRVTPEVLSSFLASTQGQDLLRTTVQSAIAQSNLIPETATDSNGVLTDAVVARLIPELLDPTTFSTLTGTPEQYSEVVKSFCTAPGVPVEEIAQRVPELDSIQFYAICIEESGIADEVLRMIQ